MCYTARSRRNFTKGQDFTKKNLKIQSINFFARFWLDVWLRVKCHLDVPFPIFRFRLSLILSFLASLQDFSNNLCTFEMWRKNDRKRSTQKSALISHWLTVLMKGVSLGFTTRVFNPVQSTLRVLCWICTDFPACILCLSGCSLWSRTNCGGMEIRLLVVGDGCTKVVRCQAGISYMSEWAQRQCITLSSYNKLRAVALERPASLSHRSSRTRRPLS